MLTGGKGGATQGGLIPFEVGVSVVGDITIAVWVGDHNMGDRIHTRPTFAYAFHTGAHTTHYPQLSIFVVESRVSSNSLANGMNSYNNSNILATGMVSYNKACEQSHIITL